MSRRCSTRKRAVEVEVQAGAGSETFDKRARGEVNHEASAGGHELSEEEDWSFGRKDPKPLKPVLLLSGKPQVSLVDEGFCTAAVKAVRKTSDLTVWHKAIKVCGANLSIYLGGVALVIARRAFQQAGRDVNNVEDIEPMMLKSAYSTHIGKDITTWIQAAGFKKDWLQPSLGWIWVASFLRTDNKDRFGHMDLDQIVAHLLWNNRCTEAAFLNASIRQWPIVVRCNIAQRLAAGKEKLCAEGKMVAFLHSVAEGAKATMLVLAGKAPLRAEDAEACRVIDKLMARRESRPKLVRVFAEGGGGSSGGASDGAAEKICAAEEKARAADDRARLAEEKLRVAEETARVAEEARKASEHAFAASVEDGVRAAQQIRQAEKHARSIEAARVVEEKVRAAEERARAAEEQVRVAEEKAAAEKAAADKAAAEMAAADKAAADKAAAEKAAAEMAAVEKAAAEMAVVEKAAAEKAAAEKKAKKAKTAEKKARSAEKKAKTAEKKAKTAEKKAKTAEKKAKIAEKKARKVKKSRASKKKAEEAEEVAEEAAKDAAENAAEEIAAVVEEVVALKLVEAAHVAVSSHAVCGGVINSGVSGDKLVKRVTFSGVDNIFGADHVADDPAVAVNGMEDDVAGVQDGAAGMEDVVPKDGAASVEHFVAIVQCGVGYGAAGMEDDVAVVRQGVEDGAESAPNTMNMASGSGVKDGAASVQSAASADGHHTGSSTTLSDSSFSRCCDADEDLELATRALKATDGVSFNVTDHLLLDTVSKIRASICDRHPAYRGREVTNWETRLKIIGSVVQILRAEHSL